MDGGKESVLSVPIPAKFPKEDIGATSWESTLGRNFRFVIRSGNLFQRNPSDKPRGHSQPQEEATRKRQ